MDVSSNSSSATTSSTNSSDDELANAARALQEGIDIKDRKWLTKTYYRCFLHSEAVSWVQLHHRKTEAGAVLLLNDLRQGGYIQHVVDPHKAFREGLTKKLYFCFVDDRNSHIRQHPSKGTANFLKQNTMTKKVLKEVLQSSDDFLALQTKLNRMASSLTELTGTQVATQTKLEIVHQCVISLIQAMVSAALLLLGLLAYTLFVIIPNLNHNHDGGSSGVMVGTTAMATILVSSFLFIAQGSRLFMVWISLDACVVQAVEGQGSMEDYEVDSKSSSSASASALPRRGLGSRRSSTRLNEAVLGRPERLLHRTSSTLQMMLSTKKMNDGVNKKVVQQRQASDLLDPSSWPHRPVMVCVNTPVSPSLTVPTYGQGPCPIGNPFHFSSELFEGQCLIRLRGISNSDNPVGDDAYFAGRRRLFQTIVQGRFKQPIPVSDVLTGHEFAKPLEHLPHHWILKAATNLIGKLAPGADIQVVGNQPTMLASLAATSQIVRGDEEGNEPDIASTSDDEIQEDCSSLGGKFTTGKVSATGRKLHLANPERASKYTFDTETVYTFDFYQSLLDVTTYSLNMGVANIGMAPILNGQPIQCLCKTTDGRYLWSFQIWHESLLPPAPVDGPLSPSKKAKSN